MGNYYCTSYRHLPCHNSRWGLSAVAIPGCTTASRPNPPPPLRSQRTYVGCLSIGATILVKILLRSCLALSKTYPLIVFIP